ncbi:probable E3 ubiquitin-protein ligase RNF144A-A isoform X1 [Lates japonicus]|uniref:Probable E3 ubiquitin-protein ligase RNF144A-A isoform X1 n=1 Tax=Lates japonicus TaxID=270547 RepID=A0AAD3MG33_LATJO|nr:probable E3 ubiquitin-protein ligase RNF144A-A isoform X1 [Lates japonicus]
MGCGLSTLGKFRQNSRRNRSRRNRSTATGDRQRNNTTRQNQTSYQQINVNPGQQGRNETKLEKCYDPEDSTLRPKFVDREDDLDVECCDYDSVRALMSCGHTVTPMSLTKWCLRLLDKGEYRFICAMPGCDAEWSYEEVCEMALLNPKEREYFERSMFSAAKNFLDVKSCPGCNSSVVRQDLNDLSVTCTLCTADRKHPYIFCWQCLKEWKGPAPRSDRCENDGCFNQSLNILKTCPVIIFEDVEEVTGCPSIRACPTCGQLVEHNSTKCKNIVCPRCKKEFCFVCLKLTDECLETSEHFIQCYGGVAPRQTSIPVWTRK